MRKLAHVPQEIVMNKVNVKKHPRYNFIMYGYDISQLGELSFLHKLLLNVTKKNDYLSAAFRSIKEHLPTIHYWKYSMSIVLKCLFHFWHEHKRQESIANHYHHLAPDSVYWSMYILHFFINDYLTKFMVLYEENFAESIWNL